MLFALLFACVKELSCTPKIKTFLPFVILSLLNVPPSSKQIPYPLYSYLLVSAFLVICIDPNKAFYTVKVLSLLDDIESNL